MRSMFLLLAVLVAGCAGPEYEVAQARTEFLAAKDLKDRLYAERDDCPRLMDMFSQDVVFWENGMRMPYDFLVQYCPNLPRDIWEPEATSVDRFMLGEHAAYEILTERLADPEDGSAYIRTTTEIWQDLGGVWKITHMNIGLHRLD
jgi:hypothetical protein